MIPLSSESTISEISLIVGMSDKFVNRQMKNKKDKIYLYFYE